MTHDQLKIGVNTLFYIPGEVGGTETYLRRNLHALTAQFPEAAVALFTNRENDPVLRQDLKGYCNVEYHLLNFRASNRPMRIIREQTELPLRARQAGIHVMWSPGYTAPVLSLCPQVVTIHDMQYRTHPEDMSAAERWATHVLVTSAAMCCTRIIAISEFGRREILRHLSVSPRKVRKVFSGVEIDDFVACENEITNEINGFKTKNPFILCIANTYPHKNVHMLVEAFGKIADRIPHDLVLVGVKRRGENQVRTAVSRMRQKHRIVRLSGLTTAQLALLYKKGDLFVFPSLYEGFGLPVLEAMAAGIPVVTTRMASIPEVGGEYALYVDPPDADGFANHILSVLRWTDNRRSDWTHAARIYASGFRWEATAAETMAVLEEAYRAGQGAHRARR